MGYYTRYSLSCPEEDGDIEIAHISNIRYTWDEAKYALDEDGDCADETKWYSHEDHLIEYSRAKPNILFTLTGIGEQPDDLWVKYFRSGRFQIAKSKIVHPPCIL